MKMTRPRSAESAAVWSCVPPGSTFGLKQLDSHVFPSPKVYEQKAFEGTLEGIWALARSLKAEKSGNSRDKRLDME